MQAQLTQYYFRESVDLEHKWSDNAILDNAAKHRKYNTLICSAYAGWDRLRKKGA